MTRWTHSIIALMAVALLVPALAVAKPTPPDQLARQTVENVLNSMRGRRDELRDNPQELYSLIDKELVPLIDLPYMSQLVLGRYWRTASPSQRQRFEVAFKNMVIRTYGNALLGFQNDDNVKYLPVRAPAGARNVVFHAIVENGGDNVRINLKMHLVDGHWRVYDGTVGNLSFVTNYRGQFNAQVRRNGLESLISRMEERYNGGS